MNYGHRWRRRREEAGDTLIEILITILIVSVAGLALMESFTTTITGSAQHRSLAGNDLILRAAAEYAFSMIEQQSTPAYSACATAGTYNTDAQNIAAQLPGTQPYQAPANYTATITTVLYWVGNVWTTTVPSCSATAVPQQITMQVTNANGTTDSTIFVANNLNKSLSTTATVAVVSLSPHTIQQGAASVSMVVTGAGFNPDAQVSFSSSAIGTVTTIYVNSTTLNIIVNVSANAPTGSYNVLVKNPLEGTAGEGDGLLQVTGAPTVINLTPANGQIPTELAQGGSESFVLSGTQFVSGMSVSVFTSSGGDPGITISSVSVTSSTTATFILAASPSAVLTSSAGPNTGDIFTVTLPGAGSDTSVPLLQVIPPPTISSVSPSPCDVGLQGTGWCTINGSNFEPGVAVAIGDSTVGIVNSVTYTSDSQLMINVSGTGTTAGATSSIIVTNPDGTSSTLANGFQNG
jgi:type II secretory pathway pseudopilin PulG